jgi:hypothetical protein
MNNLKYTIAKETFLYSLSGETETGAEKVLLHQDDNLVANTTWSETGYCIADFLSPIDFEQIKIGITKQVADLIVAFGGEVNEAFSLENYHLYVNDEIHLKVARFTSDGWDAVHFPVNIEKVNKRISEVLGVDVSIAMPPKGEQLYCLRLVRPTKMSDSNPPHRDVWLDILRNAVNIYVPLAGSNEHSSLPLLPGSHLLPEHLLIRTTSGAVVNGNKYTVPCVVSIDNQEYSLIRPNPAENQMTVFSPYLVHGGGTNLNPDTTRVSLEIRFWRK